MNRESINFELLRIAKELAINEYVDHRAQLHNQWLVDSDLLWRTKRLRLAYPPIPPYPTEKDVLAKANSLLAFLGTPQGKPETVTTVNPPNLVEEDVVAPVAIPVGTDVIEPSATPVPTEIVEEVPIEPVTPPAEQPKSERPSGGWQTPEEEIEERRTKKFPSILKNFWNRDDKN